ncbi:ATP-binding protein [uncultured Streptomyces sp.]|uniref:ATP-binding protein n=1 Tax=uncultured Streptomyces sp. TaxID=174707 RepID=UPI0026361688|nr:ATP-binding protein [uncultured Streptomyces sp.]
MADQQEANLTLPSDPMSVPVARRHVSRTLVAWGLDDGSDLADTLRLITSELATNAVQHTLGRSPTFTVHLALERDEELRLGVADSHPRPPRRLPAAVRQDNGRGLPIIRSLVKEHGGTLGVTPTPDGGKTVWVVLPWPAAAV